MSIPDRRNPKRHTYTATVERDVDGECCISYEGLPPDRFVRLAKCNKKNHWGALAIGRIGPSDPMTRRGRCRGCVGTLAMTVLTRQPMR